MTCDREISLIWAPAKFPLTINVREGVFPETPVMHHASEASHLHSICLSTFLSLCGWLLGEPLCALGVMRLCSPIATLEPKLCCCNLCERRAERLGISLGWEREEREEERGKEGRGEEYSLPQSDSWTGQLYSAGAVKAALKEIKRKAHFPCGRHTWPATAAWGQTPPAALRSYCTALLLNTVQEIFLFKSKIGL